MKRELEQTVTDVMNNPLVQKSVPPATITSGVMLVFEILPKILGLTATGLGIAATIYIIRRNKLESKKLSIEIEILKKRKKKWRGC